MPVSPLETLLEFFVELHPDDAARAFESLDRDEAERLFASLPEDVVVELANRLEAPLLVALLRTLNEDRASSILGRMEPRASSTLLMQFDEERRDEILDRLPPNVAKPVRALLGYPEDSAGGMMQPGVASFPIDLTVQQAIQRIRTTPREVLHYLYVTDRKGRLVGVLNMRDLLLASPKDRIEPIVYKELLTVPDVMPREEVISTMREHGFLAIPVVDLENRLVGVVKQSDALQVGQEEGFEDLQILVGAGAEERALSPVSVVVKSRLPWLLVNLATAFLAAGVVSLFEDLIAKIAALAVLLPVVAGQGGNAGAQSLAVVMRGLALREILPGRRYRVVMKEALAGFVNGALVAIVSAAGVLAWRLLAGDTPGAAGGLALVIVLAMIINMVAATVAGALIPFVLRAFGQDPAQSASIFLTTVTDIVGFGSFLGLATILASALGVT